MRTMLLLFIATIIFSCNKNEKLELALMLADNNRPELQKVLDHYKFTDKNLLKHKAAVYLIENMPGHYSYDSILMNEYHNKAIHIYNIHNDFESRRKALIDLSDSISLVIDRIEDINYISASYLIRSIDRSFELWQQEDAARHINFEEFRECLLPYKVADGQVLDDWKYNLYKKYEYDTIHYQINIDSYHSNINRARHINWVLKEKLKPVIEYQTMLPLISSKVIDHIPTLDCEGYTHIAAMVLRSKGIPILLDHTPQWGNRSYGHSWNLLPDTDGRCFDFAGISGVEPGALHLHYDRASKVYRATYARNDDIIELLSFEKNVPAFIKNGFFEDVTSKYFKTLNIEILDRFKHTKKSKYGYLSVYNNSNWEPVAYGKKKYKSIEFENIVPNIIYLPQVYTKHGVETINYPFKLRYDGGMDYYNPDTTKRFSYEFNRKYPIRERMFFTGGRWIGGKIQVAGKADFSDAKTIFTIDKYNSELSIQTDTIPPHRYWRYLSSESGNVFVSEMMFMNEKDSTSRITGKVIGTEGSWGDDPIKTKEAMFDNNVLTHFDAPIYSGAWAGTDFGKPIKVSKIILYPTSDGNSIELNDIYELFYYGKGEWISLGRKTATDIRIRYDNIPSNAVYLLDDITKGSEKRIFTIENQKIVWW